MDFFPYYYVDFNYYCQKCKDYCYKHYRQEKCKKCMKIQYRVDTNKPIYFEERETEEK